MNCCALVPVVMVKDIRRAFKKIALEKHPDKNPNDPDAHAQFVKINTAFEVLKDEELRKKYDKFGENGLKQDGPNGGGFQGWQYYNEVRYHRERCIMHAGLWVV
jgi:DnaJ family protein C protein 10